MTRLKFKFKCISESSDLRWDSDVNRIVRICAENGYTISKTDAQAAWEEYSDSLATCWLSFIDRDDANVLRTILQYCEESVVQNLSQKKEVKIRWYAANGVQLRLGNTELFLTKRETKELRNELLDFVNFYKDEFTPENIDYVVEYGDE